MSDIEQRITKLKELLQLEEEKRKCQQALVSIEGKIAQLQQVILGGAPAPARSVAPAVSVRKAPRRVRPSRSKPAVNRAVAGKAPAAKAPATQSAPAKAPAAKAPVSKAPANKAPVKPAKSGGAPKRGAVTERIVAALKEAGMKGASIKELEAKTGTRYGHLSVWFATTGKKTKGVEKVAPGRYRFRDK